MNLFLLSWCVEQCAKWHFDKHVVKMIVELAQLLSTAHWELVSPEVSEEKERLFVWQQEKLLYRATHRNHPCAVWVRAHPNNYRFTCRLAKALCNEYYHRFGVDKYHRHLTETIIDHLIENEPKRFPPCFAALVGPHQVTQPAQAMPVEYKVAGDAVAAYRNYYCSEQKQYLAAWKRRDVPAWFPEELVRKEEIKRKQDNDKDSGTGSKKTRKRVEK